MIRNLAEDFESPADELSSTWKWIGYDEKEKEKVILGISPNTNCIYHSKNKQDFVTKITKKISFSSVKLFPM